MKKGYIRLYIFELLIAIFLFLNSFVLNILSSYNIILFIGLLLVIFHFFFGFEKYGQRYTKNVVVDVIIYLTIFLILYYMLGFVVGFAKHSNFINLSGFKNYIIPITITIILQELLRRQMLIKAEGNNNLIKVTCILFILMSITNSLSIIDFSNAYAVFMFIASMLLPQIAINILCTYICIKTSSIPSIVFLLIINLYSYILPIVPNPNYYVKSIINIVIPLLLFCKIYIFFRNEADEDIEIARGKRDFISFTIPAILIIVVVYFVSGYFKYYALAIASGSMHPAFDRGDAVIVEKVKNNYDKIKIGDIIAYKHGNIVIVHRVIEVTKDNNHYIFYTQGDANESPDSWGVKEKDIIGIVNLKIKYLALPSVWVYDNIKGD